MSKIFLIFVPKFRYEVGEYRLDISQLRVVPDGFLPNGTYWYQVTAILPDGGMDLSNCLKVVAKYRWNSISIFWDEVPGATAYRVYRRGVDGIGGSVLTNPPAFFHDNGLMEFE